MSETIINQNQEGDGGAVNRRRKVPVRTKLLFASGTLQEATVTAGNIVTILFYNQVLGLSPAVVGTAYLIASIIDAISDPLVGFLSDRFQSRWGRRHPFMLFSALPIAVGFFFLYQPIDGLSDTGLFIWLLTFLVMVRLGQTFYLIPHDALGAELTDDYEERTSVFGYNSVGQMILSMTTAMLLYYAIFPSTPEYENGLLNEAGYIVLATTGLFTIVFSVIVCTLGTLDQLPYLHKVEVSKKFIIRGYFQELSALLRNRSYVSACLGLLTMYIGLGIIGVAATYAYIYVYGLSTEQMFWAAAAKIPGVLVVMPLLWFLSKRLDKKHILMFSLGGAALFVSSPHILKLFDLFPGNDSPVLLFALFVPLLLGYMILPLSMIVIDSQLVDIADDHEHRTGSRAEGVVFSVRSFGIKATDGVGGFLAGFGLEMINFPEVAEVGQLAAETLTGLLVLNGPVYLGVYLLAIFFLSFYQIDNKRHDEILKDLEARREQASSAGK